MIRQCADSDFDVMLAIVNDAARAYKGVIPDDRWHDPYMPERELRHEIDHGVAFWGHEHEGELLGVMGVQPIEDVTLIRHAYVRTTAQQHGIGGGLLDHLYAQTSDPMLVGTWADADWAVGFYERRGFQVVSPEEKDRLLRRYWSVPERQIETSVVLADERWFDVRSMARR
ncbi:MAG TPA: GNAT family N-acetyltransferase [Dehalococcoidia bacterium]|nr:GNAT family N-acetyltransferase [Dehalococcoidia bacterium]